MDEKLYQAAIDRTEAKIRYANVHLEELKNTSSNGNDFERAHQESFLFHLHGVKEAYLHELNIKLDIGLPIEKVSINNLKNKLEKIGIESRALIELYKLESDKNNWLSISNELRNHSTHRNSVPRLFHAGGEKSGQVYLTNTNTGELIDEDFITLFERWCKNMSDLINELRKL